MRSAASANVGPPEELSDGRNKPRQKARKDAVLACYKRWVCSGMLALMEQGRANFQPVGAGAVLLSGIGVGVGAGALVGWAAGSVPYGVLAGAAAGVPIGVFAVYLRYRETF